MKSAKGRSAHRTAMAAPVAPNTDVDGTARRLFDADRTSVPSTRSTVRPALVPRPELVPVPTQDVTQLAESHGGTDEALRYLEAEWAMRMEAPLSALASLEQSVTQAVDRVRATLPRP
jgi:hypothetical protein